MKGALPEERFSGHESFVCRYGWLRKAYDGVVAHPGLFTDLDGAIVALGVGSNMVKSVEFWARSFGVIEAADKKARRYQPTAFGRSLFDAKSGSDPYLEDLGSLWLLHWKLVRNANLAAWTLVFQDLQEWRVTRSRLAEMLQRRGRRNGAALVESTVRQHLDMLINTYSTPKTDDLRALEESLGSPLHELGLISRIELDGAETTVEIKVGPKPTLPSKVLLNAVIDHWENVPDAGASISLQEIMFGRLSPGIVFKLDEGSAIGYLNGFAELTGEQICYRDGSLIRGLQLARNVKLSDVRKRMRLA